jgi:hypothetical protein
MGKFIHDKALDKAIAEILSEAGFKCAVAFWGHRAKDYVKGKGGTIICNLLSGGTNPAPLEELSNNVDLKLTICKHDKLHAKVYLGECRAVVASANVSANGLGLAGKEQAGWKEAGVLLEDNQIDEIKKWFENILRSATSVHDADWRLAKQRYDLNRRMRPTVSIADFDFEQGPVPHLQWTGHDDWDANYEVLRPEFKVSDSEIITRLDDSIELEHSVDEPIVRGRWIMSYRATRDLLASQRMQPWWTLAADRSVVKNAFRYGEDDDWRNVMLAAEVQPPPPFDITSKAFRTALNNVLKDERFAAFREQNYEGAWFAPREHLLLDFWLAVQLQTRLAPS